MSASGRTCERTDASKLRRSSSQSVTQIAAVERRLARPGEPPESHRHVLNHPHGRTNIVAVGDRGKGRNRWDAFGYPS